MADVCADIIDELRADPTVRRLVVARIFAGKVPPGTLLPFIWMQRRGVEMSGTMEVDEEPLKEMLSLECVSDDPTEAVELSDAARAALDGRRGMLGYNAYSWVGVSDMREGYIPKNLDADEILHISSLDVEVFRP
jgi:hypothetical protein